MNRAYLAVLPLCVLLVGCATETEQVPEKLPRPVEVVQLKSGFNPNVKQITGSVGSWKTEQIAFENGGRITRVIEPNEDVEGRIPGLASFQLGFVPFADLFFQDLMDLEPTPIAEIEKERYLLQVRIAETQLEQAKKAHAAANIELLQSIPQQKLAAVADQNLADTELKRAQRLVDQDAGAQADVDRAKAKFETALAQIKQLEATELAKSAEIESLLYQIEQADQSLQDAKRNLRNCTLFSSFRGQIAEVHVVPGSIVGQGEPVATVQMMDPIKIEFEVSAEESRTLRGRQRLNVKTNRDEFGKESADRDGYIYLVDPVADPQTRTFTVTLLILNEKTESLIDQINDPNIAATDQLWRMDFKFLPGADSGLRFVSVDAIHQDEQGHYVWKINDVTINEPLPANNRLSVSKLRVEPGPLRVPFLGNFNFQQVKILDDDFDVNRQMVAGRLRTSEGEATNWDGDTIVLDRGRKWILRPGDLVTVELDTLEDIDNSAGRYFIPMDAIAHLPDGKFVFLLNSEDNTVQQVQIEITDATEAELTSSLRRIQTTDTSIELENRYLVVKGVHYLRDGEKVNVIAGGESQ